LGDRQDAIRQFQLGLDLLLRMPQDANNRVIQRDLDTTYGSLGDALLMEGRTAEAEKNFEKELATIQTVASADKTDTSTLLYLGSAYADVGRGLVEAGNPRKGIPFLRKAVAEGEHLQSLSSTNWDATNLAQLEVWLGEGLGAAGERNEERELYRKALEIYTKVSAADPRDFQDAIDVAECHDRLATSLLRSGNLETAQKEYAQALELAQKIAPSVPESVDVRYLMAATYSGLGDMAAVRSRTEDSNRANERRGEARKWYEQSLEVWAKIPNPSHIAPNEFRVDLPSVIEQRRAQNVAVQGKGQDSLAAR
jgi:tetratricopeptide (TPR) repeat protein